MASEKNNLAAQGIKPASNLKELMARRKVIKTVAAGGGIITAGAAIASVGLSKTLIGLTSAQQSAVLPPITVLLLDDNTPISGTYVGTASVTDTVQPVPMEIPEAVDVTLTVTICLEVVSSTHDSAVVNIEAGVVVELSAELVPYADSDVYLYGPDNAIEIPVSEQKLTKEFETCQDLSLFVDVSFSNNGLPVVEVNPVNDKENSMPVEPGNFYSPSPLIIPLAPGQSTLPTGSMDCGIDTDSTEVQDEDDDAATDPPL
jgi:hypothetical protein